MEERNNIKALEELAKQSDEKYIEMLKNNEITKLFRAIGLFPDQTITNDVLILSQRPEAICVKRMKDWNFYKRSVRKGEKSIKVISHFIDKYDQEYTDESGTVYTKGIEQLKTDIGYVFDISQTEGSEYQYLNSNKENIAKYFDVAKSALEKTAKDYKFEYKDIEENSIIDKENRVITIKDGLELNDVINTLIRDVSIVLLDFRNQKSEGLTDDKLKDIDTVQVNAAIYAINSKLGLDVPDYDFSEISKLDESDMFLFKENLQKVRSSTKQLLSNFERAIEKAVRDIDKRTEQAKEQPVEEKTEEKAVKSVKSKSRTKTKQTESEVE